jgi:hypothetical protein
MTSAVLHRRQFVLGPQPVQPDSAWHAERTDEGLVLSRSPELPCRHVRDARGLEWFLLGTAVETTAGGKPPAVALAELARPFTDELVLKWAGRWILIGGGRLRLDPCGCLGCFYRVVDGSTWVSSSPALLNDLPGVDPAPVASPPLLANGKGMDWYPPPASRFEGIARLLPSQHLELAGGHPVEGRLPRPREPRPDYAAALDAAQELLTSTVAAYAGDADAVWVPLTGGYDSRLVLAAAVAAEVPVVTYTFDKAGLSPGDRMLPPRLASLVGAEHRFLRPRFPLDPRRAELFDVHCARHSIEIDREYFARGAWDEVPGNALLLRGGVFEVARGFYYRRFPPRLPDDPDAALRILADTFQLGRFHRGSTAHWVGLESYLSWTRQMPEPALDWRDRLYLEQTMGGWLGSTVQALDLFAPELGYPANSLELLSVLLSIDPVARREGRHHRDLIARLAPPLAREEFNPPDRLDRRARGLVRRELDDFLRYPGRVDYVRHRARWIRDRVRPHV